MPIQASGVHEEEGWLLGCIFLRLQSSLIPLSLHSHIDMHPLTWPGTYMLKRSTQTHRQGCFSPEQGNNPNIKANSRSTRQEPSKHTNKVSRQGEVLWGVSVLLQEEPTNTRLATLIRCECCPAPRCAAQTEGCCSEQDV